MQSEYDESKKNYITYDQILLLKEMSLEVKEIKKETRDLSRHFNTFLAERTERIELVELLEALSKYPRKYKSKKQEDSHLDGMDYFFVADGKNVNLQFKNGEILKTS